MTQDLQAIKVKRKYYLLRLISILLKFLGVLLLIGSIIGIVTTFGMIREATGSELEEIIPFVLLALCIMGIVGSILIFTFSEIIKILIDIEENTRKNLKKDSIID